MIIGIDCSSKEGGLATDEKTFYSLDWVEDITSKINELGVNSREIEKILITHGPGSFTSLRVGLVTAQGIAFPQKIPIYAYSTFLAMAEGACDGNLIPVIPARNRVVYTAYYRKNDNRLEEIFKDRIFKIEEFIAFLEESFKKVTPIIFGQGADANKDILEEEGFPVSSFSFPPIACSLISLYEKNAECVTNPVIPLYLSHSAAVRKRIETEIKIREMKEEDLQQISEIENDVFFTPWPYDFFLPHLRSDACVKLVAEIDDKIVGYLVGCEEDSRFHLRNIAVSRECWRQGLGTKLLSYLLELLKEKPGVRFCYLEHRVNNEAAFELYKSLGFTFKGIKKDYYKKCGDAVVMEYKI
ncbi:MAG: ribosomal protein S18-alanine N-acetyltransferase [candidate division WOR-3 bacterium]|jgi:ribosomal-protein-alanine acetyltransferase/tRNA threonylcarbamoyl adenosine modification protein YeaZ